MEQTVSTVLVADSGFRVVDAQGINAGGQIVADGDNPNGREHALLLTLNGIPEPTSVVMFGLGAIGLIVAMRRRHPPTRPK